MQTRTPVGMITIQKWHRGLQTVQIAPRATGKPGRSADPVLRELKGDLIDYFKGHKKGFTKYMLNSQQGTGFQRIVWEAARTIPYGQIKTYGWLARKIGKPQACRAVGAALGSNPFLLVVPCHRVVAANGTLGGFRAGLKVKKWLLEHEGAIEGKSHSPKYKSQKTFKPD